VFFDPVEPKLEKLPSEIIVVDVVVLEEFVETTKGQQSGLSSIHPMKAA